MKKLIVLISLLASYQSFAGLACNANYAAGIGHVFKGEVRLVGNNEKILEGQSSKDSRYTVTLSKGVPQLFENISGKEVKMGSQEVAPGMKVYATSTLKLYPSGIPGTDAEHRFIIILCADENSF